MHTFETSHRECINEAYFVALIQK